MSVIQLTVTENKYQSVSGIPLDVTIATDIPSTIFYTLDGSIPTISSNIYIGPIKFPTNQNSVIFQAFATNGVDSSVIFNKTYAPDINSIRKSTDKVLNNGLPQNLIQQQAFGSPSVTLPVEYGTTGLRIVDAPGIPNQFDGYDGTATGTPKGGTDLPIDNYQILKPERDSKGNYINTAGLIQPGMTNGKVSVIRTPKPPETSNTNNKLFNPRALVIYQDSRNPPDTNGVPVPQINKYFYSALDPQKTRDGSLATTSAFDAQTLSGSFVRSEFNAEKGTATYYYYDNQAQQWIISTEAYVAKKDSLIYYGMVFPSRPNDNNGSRWVYRWPTFINRQGPI